MEFDHTFTFTVDELNPDEQAQIKRLKNKLNETLREFADIRAIELKKKHNTLIWASKPVSCSLQDSIEDKIYARLVRKYL